VLEIEEREYDAFEHLVLGVNLGFGDLMAMFSFYCDDSGTHEESPVAVAACLISSVDKWTEFQKSWCEVNKAENFGVFHMADFENSYEQFSAQEWRDENKKQRTLSRLIGAIRTNVQTGMAVAVVKSDYDKVIPPDIRDRFKLGKNHYTFAIRTCLGHVLRWRKEHGYTQPMTYVFDRMGKGKGEINAMFESALTGQDLALRDFGIYKDCWSFADKDGIAQLQGADICAWETLRYMNSVFMRPRGRQQAIRWSFALLYKEPLLFNCHNEKTLTEVVEFARLRKELSEAN
jgi:hypothetical protein